MSWMRENAKWIMIVTIGLFILGFIALPAVRYFFTPSQQRYLGTIDGKQVEMNTYLQQVDQERERFLETHDPPLTNDQRNKIRRQALIQVTNQVMMQNIVQEEGGSATSQEIRQLFSQRFRNKRGQINQRRVNQILRNLSPKRRKKIAESSRQQIESFRMIQWIQNQVDQTDTEFEAILQTGLREVELYGIYIDPKKLVDQERLRSYYETNKSDFRSKPRVLLREIVLDMSDTATGGQSGDLSDLKGTIDTIRRRHKAGDSFAQLAREYSADTETAPEGGLRGWVTPEDLREEISRVAFSTDTKTISNLVQTPGRIHLLYVEKGPIRPYKPLEDVQETIASKLLSDTHWTQASNRAEEFKQEITSADEPFEQLKEIAFLKSHSSFASPREGYYGWVPVRFVVESLHPNFSTWSGELSRNKLIFPEISKSISGLEPNTVSDPVRSESGYHLFYVSESRSPDIEDVELETKDRLRRIVRQSKRSNLLSQWLEKRRQKVSINLDVPKSRIGGKIPWQNKKKSS